MSRWNGNALPNILIGMTKLTPLRSPRAFAATIAVLALVPFPVLAQDAAPAAEAAAPAVPEAAASVAPVPVIVSQPVVQAVPAAVPEEPAVIAAAVAPATSARPVRPSTAPRTAVPAAADVPAASSPAQQSLPAQSAGQDAATQLAPEAAPVAAVAPAAKTPAAPDTSRGLAALALGGALATFGASAVLVMSRRRRRPVALAEPAHEPAPSVAAVRPVATYAAPVGAATAPQSAWTDAVPQLIEQRRAVIDAMVAAKPDAANPFRSAKARRRRARLIIQGREQPVQDTAQQPLDFRQYRPAQPVVTGREPAFA